MRKLYVLAALLVAGSSSMAQDLSPRVKPVGDFYKLPSEHNTFLSDKTTREDVWWTEDFDGGMTTANGTWTTDGANGDVWYWTQDAPKGQWTGGASSQFQTDTSRFDSYKNGFMIFGADSMNTPDGATEWDGAVVSPTIDLSAATSVLIKFQQHMRVCCSEANASMTVGFSSDDGTTWTDVDVRNVDINIETDNPESLEVKAPGLAGSATCKIRFRWQGASHYFWAVDDIQLVSNPDHDLVLSDWYYGIDTTGGYSGIAFRQFSFTQNRAIQFTGQVYNRGNYDETNVDFMVDVTNSGGTNVYSADVAPFTMKEDTTINVVDGTMFTLPNAEGTYKAMASVTYDSVAKENTPETLSDSTTFIMNEYMYGRDDNVIVGGIWNGEAATEGQYNAFTSGIYMDVFADDKMAAVNFFPHGATDPGTAVIVSISKWDTASGAYVELYSNAGDEYVITAEDMAATGGINIPIEGGLDVKALDFLKVGVGCYEGAESLVVGYCAEPTFNYAFFVDEDGTEYGESRMPMIRLQSEGYDVGVREEANNAFALNQNVPNPFTGETVISYEMKQTSEVMLQIVDLTGKVVFTQVEGTKAVGTHNITVDASNFAAGMYYYTLTAGDVQMTKKMMVK